VAQAAAFVNTLDPVVDGFAREATRTAALMGDLPFAGRNLVFMAAIFDALAVLGVTYVPDPSNPYATVSTTPRAVDTVAYPRETLARKTGDCDDTSVLVAALLGNVGIATQIVDVPGHLFVLADAGVHARNQLALGLDSARVVVADDEVWIPLETTALRTGFAEAWRVGAEEYATWSARGRLSLVDIAEASSRYEPASPGAPAAASPAVDAAALETRVRQDLGTMAAWRTEFFASRYGDVEARLDATPEALNDVARVYFSAGELDEAAATLERARSRTPDSPQTTNNLAALDVARGDLDTAIGLYQRAARLDSSDAGIWLNLGLVRQARGDSADAAAAIARGVFLSGGYPQACALLGLATGDAPTREGTQRMTADEARALLRSALARVPRPTTSARRGGVTAPTPRPRRHWISRVAGGRGADEAALQDILYWRDS